MQRLRGIGVSPGIGAGRAVILIQRTQVLRFSIPATGVGQELARLDAARRSSADQLNRIQGPISWTAYRRGCPAATWARCSKRSG